MPREEMRKQLLERACHEGMFIHSRRPEREPVDISRHTVRLGEFLWTLCKRNGDLIGIVQAWSNPVGENVHRLKTPAEGASDIFSGPCWCYLLNGSL